MSCALVIGVTGGIGSGKSAVTKEFESLGIEVFDADIAAREVVVPGSPGLDEIRAAFGDQVIQNDGTLDRTKLRTLVFDDPAKRELLEKILHPKIRQRIDQQLIAAEGDYCLLSVPLLVERDGHYNFDRILVVDCSEALQIERVKVRDGLTDSKVRAIMSTQATRQQRLAIADDVIDNSGRIEDLEPLVLELHQKYLEIARAKEQQT